jgi:hypothetical protein
MVALEQEIVEKFRLLDKDAQQRVRRVLNEHTPERFDLEGWWKRVEAVQAEIRAVKGNTPMDVVGMLREIREDE